MQGDGGGGVSRKAGLKQFQAGGSAAASSGKLFLTVVAGGK